MAKIAKRKHFYSIRLSEPERRAFRDAASVHGMNLASWIRMALREKVRNGADSITLSVLATDRRAWLEAAASNGQDLMAWIVERCNERVGRTTVLPNEESQTAA